MNNHITAYIHKITKLVSNQPFPGEMDGGEIAPRSSLSNSMDFSEKAATYSRTTHRRCGKEKLISVI